MSFDFFSAFLTDSHFRTAKSYYRQVFLEECKYTVKENKILKYVIEDIKFLAILPEKILMKKILIKSNSDRKI